MALTLDPTVIEETEATADGVEVPLTDEQLQSVVFNKYENTDMGITDVQHYGEWTEQIVADIPFGRSRRARIGIADPDSESLRSVRENDGLIIDLAGTSAGVYGFIDGRYVTEDETELWEDTNGQEAVRCTKWDFRVVRILRTNGPELRNNAFRSQEQKEAEGRANMFETISEAFKIGVSNLGESNPTASAEQLLASVDMEKIVAEMERRSKGAVEAKPKAPRRKK
tara:strand:+ start:3049 stop:3726 length:678 start_codon:yes stop_codon:yes gene_type:complete